MWLQSLRLENFRSFEQLDVKFQKDYTVLIGVNGSGKTAILDAAVIALGSFLAGLDGISTNSLHAEDVRYAMYEQGSVATREKQYPVVVQGQLGISEKSALVWSRELNGEGGRTTIRNAKAIMEYAAQLQKKVRSGNEDTILPLIAYYGTGRLWAKKQTRSIRSAKRRLGPSSRILGYKDCLDAISNTQLMLDWFQKMTYQQLQDGELIPELQAVQQAMANCYRNMDLNAVDVKIRYSVKYEELEIVIKRKNDTLEYLPLHQLSDGIRTILTMVADIAYRMAVLNSFLLDECIRKTPGIVLIDEVDMHLHPAWQKNIIQDLRSTFPQVQFIVTTHAPSILANTSNKNIRVLENGKIFEPLIKSYGRNIDEIMYELMRTQVRPDSVTALISTFYQMLDKGDLVEAKNKLEELRALLGDNDQTVLDAQMAYDLEEA